MKEKMLVNNKDNPWYIVTIMDKKKKFGKEQYFHLFDGYQIIKNSMTTDCNGYVFTNTMNTLYSRNFNGLTKRFNSLSDIRDTFVGNTLTIDKDTYDNYLEQLLFKVEHPYRYQSSNVRVDYDGMYMILNKYFNMYGLDSHVEGKLFNKMAVESITTLIQDEFKKGQGGNNM